MKIFDEKFISSFKDYTKTRKPNFENILTVLNRGIPERFTLFEFFMNNEFYRILSGYDSIPENEYEQMEMRVKGFAAAGYDYCTLYASDFTFPTNASNHGKASMSVNSGAVIFDRKSYEAYQWLNPRDFDTSRLETLKPVLPEGMKIIVCGPGGVLENVTFLLGYEGLCYMLADDPELVEEVFDQVGSRLVQYYELALQYDSVGACISNDDWGFYTQTMLSVPDMRKYVFKWHKKIAEVIHRAGRPAILHSCGQLSAVHDDIITDMKYDGKHSYEDKIMPVEQAYDILNPDIAVLGGLDLDFICRRSPCEIYERACVMLEKSRNKGGYALGSGNSIPAYTPYENYLAMLAAAIVN